MDRNQSNQRNLVNRLRNQLQMTPIQVDSRAEETKKLSKMRLSRSLSGELEVERTNAMMRRLLGRSYDQTRREGFGPLDSLKEQIAETGEKIRKAIEWEPLT